MARILLKSSAVRVHDSQAYRKMDATRERLSRTLQLREMLLSFETGLNLVNAAVRAILEWVGTLLAHVLEACDCLKLLPVCVDLLVDAAGVV